LRLDSRRSIPGRVLLDYEELRRSHLDNFLRSDWTPTDYALLDPPARLRLTHSVIEDGRVHMDISRVRKRMMDHLAELVEGYGRLCTVVEAGSGTGRNLIWLAHRLQIAGKGIELTPSGVEAGRRAAERYHLDLTFEEADLTDPKFALPEADLVLSVHALEQIPDARPVVDKMVAAAKRAVIMIEPFPEFWPGGLAGLAHRLRARQWDRLRPGALGSHKITSARLLPFGTTVNRATEVIIEK
jgi:SAM-dependent methyltransferase